MLTYTTQQAMEALNVSTYDSLNRILKEHGIKRPDWRGKDGNVYKASTLAKINQSIDKEANPFDD